MCFTDDCDWYAEVSIDEERDTTRDEKCYECREPLPNGTIARAINMVEHELCTNDPQSDNYTGDRPIDDEGGCDCYERCEDCDFGETFDCWICLQCEKLLKAIEASEIEKGCHPNESQPAFGELNDAMFDDGDRYRAKALAMFPEIAEHMAKHYPKRGED